MTIGVYGLFDNETCECLYVGMSKEIEGRFKGHLKELHRETHKRKDFVKWFIDQDKDTNSISCFLLEEIFELDYDQLNLLEIKWFNELKPRFYGKKPSENERWKSTSETRKKQSFSINKLFSGKRIKDLPRKCKVCGTDFYHRKKSVTTCSVKCGHKATALMKSENTEYAKIGAHNRWHKNKGVISEDCEFCKILAISL